MYRIYSVFRIAPDLFFSRLIQITAVLVLGFVGSFSLSAKCHLVQTVTLIARERASQDKSSKRILNLSMTYELHGELGNLCRASSLYL